MAPASSQSAFSSKNFRTFLYGNVLSVLGIWIQRLALGWHAWQLSQSALFVGLVAAAQFLPLVTLTPFFGVFVDRVNTRIAAIVLHVILTLAATALGLLTENGGMTTDWLLALALIHGIANSAYSPVRLALIPALVHKEQLPGAVAVSAMLFNLSRFIGPGIAGVVVAVYGLGYAYLLNAASYLPVIFVLSILNIGVREREPGGKSYFAQLAEGFRYARAHAAIRQVILLAGVSNFFGRAILEVMPAFAALIFDGGSSALAILMASSGIGAILASVLFSQRSLRANLHALVLIGAIGVGLTMIAFALVSSLSSGALVVMFLGFFASMVGIGSQTEVQIQVDDRLRGRVMGLWTLVIMGGPALGSIVAGAMAGRFGAAPTSLAFAVSSLLLIAVVTKRAPQSA